MKALIFDLDGTLINSAPHIHQVANQLLQEQGLAPITLAQIESFIGNGVRKLIERLMKASNLGDYDLDALYAQFVEIYLEDPAASTVVYPHVRETLATFKADGYKIGICTNKLEALSVALMDGLGLGTYIDTLVGGDSTPKLKPAPEPVLEVMRRLGANADELVYIGDSEIDAEACEAAGLRFGFYEGGYCHVAPETLLMAFRFRDYRELKNRLAAIESAP